MSLWPQLLTFLRRVNLCLIQFSPFSFTLFNFFPQRQFVLTVMPQPMTKVFNFIHTSTNKWQITNQQSQPRRRVDKFLIQFSPLVFYTLIFPFSCPPPLRRPQYFFRIYTPNFMGQKLNFWAIIPRALLPYAAAKLPTAERKIGRNRW